MQKSCYRYLLEANYTSNFHLFRRVRKIAKTTISFVMSVCPHGTTRLTLDGYSINLVFGYFSKI